MTESSAPTSPPTGAPLVTATEAEWQAESRRRWLLQQMGVVPLVSRFDPTGARPADRRRLPDGVVPAATPSVSRPPKASAGSPASAPDRTQKPPLRPRPAAQSLSRPDAPTPTRAASSSVAPAPQTAPGVSFSLLIGAAAQWLWVEQLPERIVTREQLSLVTAMAEAIGGGKTELLYRQFDWPIVDNPALPRDLATAQQSLTAMLGRMQREQAPRGIILMGECNVLPSQSLPVHEIPATLTMLEQPLTKADAWRVLKPLVASA